MGAERQTAVELARKPESRGGFSTEFKREFVEKIVIMDKTLGDLADELGIPPELMHKWTLMAGRPEMAASEPGGPVFPARRVLELEHDIRELKRKIEHQAITIRILENKERV